MHAVVVVFNVTLAHGIRVCDDLIEYVRKNTEPGYIVVAVGNGIDRESSLEVSTEEARAHFEAMNPPVPYFETSAKTGEGVNELFDAVLEMLSQKNSVKQLLEESKQKTLETPTETVENENRGTEDKCIIC